MSTRESKVFVRLKERIARPTDRIERVENGLGAGMPDVNYCILGTEGWIEIKAPDEPARPDTALFASGHPVSIDQINWFYAQHMARGLAWLFIGTKQRLLLIAGSQVASLGRRINTMTVAQLERASSWRTPIPVKVPELWHDLRELLATSPS